MEELNKVRALALLVGMSVALGVFLVLVTPLVEMVAGKVKTPQIIPTAGIVLIPWIGLLLMQLYLRGKLDWLNKPSLDEEDTGR